MFDEKKLKAYRLISHHYSSDIKSDAYLLEHIKSGARVAILDNDEENKVFYIAFRTPPADSTGVAHILEHSVLCGSDEFPLKDPFVELVKGSLNTFLNAMTYPDKTVYPVASCNDQDFKNLMHVYLDAVFHPNIYHEEKIFRQEGWHYEMEDENSELKINGVVYNEMKGAFSSPDDVLARETMNSLFPDTSYGVESGGDPENIPDLTYENFLRFHGAYYHPVNSYIYFYGNADWNERLDWMDEHYLNGYDRIELDSFPGEQKPFEGVSKITKKYPISEDENEEKNTYLTYNAVVGKSTDRKLYIAFQLIDYALVSADGSRLKKALIDAGIGTDISSTFENGIYQPYYSISAKNAEPEDEERFIQIIEDELERVVKEGFDKDALTACLNRKEFRFREADSGFYPKGLTRGLKCLDSWLYDKDEPFIHIEQLDTFKFLREKIDTDYFEKLVEEYLIKNPHKSVLKLVPEKGYTAKKDKELADKLEKYRDSLSPEERKAIVTATKELKLYQETPDPEEALKCLPMLKRSDIKREGEWTGTEETEIDGIRTLFHNIDTNGILYFNMLFDMEKLPFDLYPYASLLCRVLCASDTASYSYEKLGYELDKYTGGLFFHEQFETPECDVDKYKAYIVARSSVLTENTGKLTDLIKEVLLTTKLDDEKRLKEIIAESRSGLQSMMQFSTNSIANKHAYGMLSEYAKAMEIFSGLDFYRFLKDLEDNFEEKKEEIINGLKNTAAVLFVKDNILLNVAGTVKELEALKGCIAPIAEGLEKEAPAMEKGSIALTKSRDGLTCAGQVQYVCRAGNFKRHGLNYNGALGILHTILGYDYFWLNVRVKGGAYGCHSSFARTGETNFTSYRDPNLKETLDIFEKTVSYIKDFKADEEQMTKYILGTMSSVDTPLSNNMKAQKALHDFICGNTKEGEQKIREEILNATDEDIRKLAAYVEAVLSDGAMCVAGNESKLKECSDVFDRLLPMFG